MQTNFKINTYNNVCNRRDSGASNGTVTVGAPAVEGVAVEAEILDHVQADKVIVFKKKRRKGYKVKNGHRQALTRIQITGISGL